MTSLLEQLRASGQAPWLDFVDRGFLNQGGLKKLVAERDLEIEVMKEVASKNW